MMTSADYKPLRDDSTFEFIVEYVGSHDEGAVAFGLVVKGALHEGYHLRLIRENNPERDCLCKAIAGVSKRLAKASSQEPENNIGIWLDLPAADIQPRDRLISFDSPASARQ